MFGRLASASTAGLAGFVVGAVLTLSLQGTGLPRHGRPGQVPVPVPVTTPEAPRTFLAWTPGGLPAGFRQRVAELPGMQRTVVVASDNTWMTQSTTPQGEVVDDPQDGYRAMTRGEFFDHWSDLTLKFVPASTGASGASK